MNAKQTMEQRVGTINTLMFDISEHVRDLKDQVGRQADWGMVGDANLAIEMLAEAERILREATSQ